MNACRSTSELNRTWKQYFGLIPDRNTDFKFHRFSKIEMIDLDVNLIYKDIYLVSKDSIILSIKFVMMKMSKP
jgi:hypothetical protein